MAQWLACLNSNRLSSVSSNPIKSPHCFLDEDPNPLPLLTTGLFQERIRALLPTKLIDYKLTLRSLGQFGLYFKYAPSLNKVKTKTMIHHDSTTWLTDRQSQCLGRTLC